MSGLAYAHVELSSDGVPLIEGTTTKVIEVALDRLAHHWDADEIQRQYSHLSLAQIYGALAYYYDHEEELNRDIEQRLSTVESIRQRRLNPALQAKLRAC